MKNEKQKTTRFAGIRKDVQTAKTGAIVGSLLCFIYFPEEALVTVFRLIQWNGCIIPVSLVVYYIVRNRKALRKRFARWNSRRKRSQWGLWHGVPRNELIDYLLELEESEQPFSRDPICERWMISREQFQALKDNLFSAGVLVRGPNNSTLVRPLTRQELVEILKDAKGDRVVGRTFSRDAKSRTGVIESIASHVQKKTEAKPFRVRKISTAPKAKPKAKTGIEDLRDQIIQSEGTNSPLLEDPIFTRDPKFA